MATHQKDTIWALAFKKNIGFKGSDSKHIIFSCYFFFKPPSTFRLVVTRNFHH